MSEIDQRFDFWGRGVTDADKETAMRYIGSLHRPADLVIAPKLDAGPYLYRWHLVRGQGASVYFHIQVNDDPERPLHDHPWDNMSVILGGDGYREVIDHSPWRRYSSPHAHTRLPGDVIFRRAAEAHRLFMPKCVGKKPFVPLGYTMSQFSTGPRVREWGFWFEGGWRSYHDVTRQCDGVSYHVDAETKEPI